jgi:hypothetical protein
LDGGDEDSGDLLTLNGRMQSLEGRIQKRDVGSESADCFVSRGLISGGEDKDGSDLLSVKGTMQRIDDDAADGSVSRGFVSGLVSEEEIMQDGCTSIVEDDDWEFLGCAKYRHDDSKCYLRYDRCSWPRCDEEDTVRDQEEETVTQKDPPRCFKFIARPSSARAGAHCNTVTVTVGRQLPARLDPACRRAARARTRRGQQH